MIIYNMFFNKLNKVKIKTLFLKGNRKKIIFAICNLISFNFYLAIFWD